MIDIVQNMLFDQSGIKVEISNNKIYIMKTPNFWKLKNILLHNPG